MKEKGFWEGVQAAVPTALGYVSIGLACGIIGSPYVTPVEMGLMSLFVYAGSAQFAMIALIAVQAPVVAIVMTVFLINLRLFLLSLHASTYFRHTSLWHNIGMSSILTDETYGVLMGELVHTDNFIGKLFRDIPKPGDEIAYLGIDRIAGDGTPYEAVKCFLTEESAEKFNDEKRPVTPANLAYLKSFWGKPVIIEPHRNYWIEFL